MICSKLLPGIIGKMWACGRHKTNFDNPGVLINKVSLLLTCIISPTDDRNETSLDNAKERAV